MDRITPTLEPDAPVIMYQHWRRLLFAHWEVDPAIISAKLPRGLMLDTFDGRAYVGLIPLLMHGVRPRFSPPMPWVSSFPEVNVRTYVHVNGEHPGVYFFSLDAARVLAVLGARAGFGLRYFWATMSAPVRNGWTEYRSQRIDGPKPALLHARYRPRGPMRICEPGTLDHFLIERYSLYAEHLGRLMRGQVHHQSYPVHDAELEGLDETLLAAAGLPRQGTPLLHYSDGVDVKVYPPQAVPRS